MRYYIMNKDTKVLFFDIPDNSADFNIVVMGVYNQALIPRPIKSEDDIKSWLLTRLAVLNRRDLYLRFKDTQSLSDIVELTHFISLNDTYWVNKADTEVQWSDISPYTNSLNTDIFHSHFDNISIIDPLDFFKAPTYFRRLWIKQNNDIMLYKGSSNYSEELNNDDRHTYCEVLTSEFARYLRMDAVEYRTLIYDNSLVSACRCICSEATGLYSVKDIYPNAKTFRELFDLDFGEPVDISYKKLTDMFLLDYLVLNIDRHMKNIGVLVENNTQRLSGIAPMFDFNVSLGVGCATEHKSLDAFIKAHPNTINRLTDIFKYIVSRDRGYINQLFTKASSYTFTGTYADIANEVLRHQLKLAYTIL